MPKRFAAIGMFSIAVTVLGATASAGDDDKKVGVGPIRSVRDLEDSAKMVFKLADTNNDGQISQKEATDAGNLLVGGFFFRADANGDGVLTPDEAAKAREALFAQQPLLKLVLQKAKPPEAQAANAPAPGQPSNDPATTAKQLAANPEQTLGNLLDTNHDRNIQANEVRQAVQTGVQAIFSIADTNQDGQLTPYELNAAVGEVAKSALQTAFQVADADGNGSLSMAEYDKALAEPAHAIFRVIDADKNGQLTLAELQRAEQILAEQISRLRVPEPANSLKNQTQAGRRPPQDPAVSTTGAQTPDPGTAPR